MWGGGQCVTVLGVTADCGMVGGVSGCWVGLPIVGWWAMCQGAGWDCRLWGDVLGGTADFGVVGGVSVAGGTDDCGVVGSVTGCW